MRLRWGPYATQLAEQVVVIDPLYVLDMLDTHPDGGLASVFRDLIWRLDARPFTTACARCGQAADGVCAYPGSVELIGYCRRCLAVSDRARPSPAVRIDGYEDALRHVAISFPRGHRIQMRRIARQLLAVKGGPTRLTESAITGYLSVPGGRWASEAGGLSGPAASGTGCARGREKRNHPRPACSSSPRHSQRSHRG